MCLFALLLLLWVQLILFVSCLLAGATRLLSSHIVRSLMSVEIDSVAFTLVAQIARMHVESLIVFICLSFCRAPLIAFACFIYYFTYCFFFASFILCVCFIYCVCLFHLLLLRVQLIVFVSCLLAGATRLLSLQIVRSLMSVEIDGVAFTLVAQIARMHVESLIVFICLSFCRAPLIAFACFIYYFTYCFFFASFILCVCFIYCVCLFHLLLLRVQLIVFVSCLLAGATRLLSSQIVRSLMSVEIDSVAFTLVSQTARMHVESLIVLICLIFVGRHS